MSTPGGQLAVYDYLNGEWKQGNVFTGGMLPDLAYYSLSKQLMVVYRDERMYGEDVFGFVVTVVPAMPTQYPPGVLSSLKGSLFTSFNDTDMKLTLSVFSVAFVFTGTFGAGGLIFAPVLYLFVQMSTFDAGMLSQPSMLGVSIATLIISALKVRNRIRFIDYNALLFLVPALSAGTYIGFLIRFSTSWYVINFFICITLIYKCGRLIRSGIILRREEIEEEERKNDHPQDMESKQLLIDDQLGSPISSSLEVQFDAVRKNELKFITPLFLLFALVTTIVVVSLLRGAKPNSSSIVGVTLCSLAFKYIYLLTIIILPMFSLYSAINLAHTFNLKLKIGMQNRLGEVHWTLENLVGFWFLAIVIGAYAAICGFGSGLFVIPLLAHIGMLRGLARTTTMAMTFMTCIAASMNHIVLGQISWDYVLWFAFIGCLGCSCGQMVGHLITARAGLKRSILKTIISVIVAVISIWFLINNVLRFIDESKSHIQPAWNFFCSQVAS